MAEIKSFNIGKDKVTANLELTKEEYKNLSNQTKNLVLFPTSIKSLDQPLTTGKLGNSNRIMIPKKFLERGEIDKLEKKVLSGLFKKDDEDFLLIKLNSPKKSGPNLKWETRLVKE